MVYNQNLTPDDTFPDDDAMPADMDVEDTPLEDEEPTHDPVDDGGLGV